MTLRDEVEHLLKRSEEFLETAEYQISKGFYALSAFSLEQSLQLFLKAKMLRRGIDYPRTHSVRGLLETLSELTDEQEKPTINHILQNYLLELGMLEDAYITSRYVMREYRQEEAERFLKVVKEVMKNVE